MKSLHWFVNTDFLDNFLRAKCAFLRKSTQAKTLIFSDYCIYGVNIGWVWTSEHLKK